MTRISKLLAYTLATLLSFIGWTANASENIQVKIPLSRIESVFSLNTWVNGHEQFLPYLYSNGISFKDSGEPEFLELQIEAPTLPPTYYLNDETTEEQGWLYHLVANGVGDLRGTSNHTKFYPPTGGQWLRFTLPASRYGHSLVLTSPLTNWVYPIITGKLYTEIDTAFRFFPCHVGSNYDAATWSLPIYVLDLTAREQALITSYDENLFNAVWEPISIPNITRPISFMVHPIHDYTFHTSGQYMQHVRSFTPEQIGDEPIPTPPIQVSAGLGEEWWLTRDFDGKVSPRYLVGYDNPTVDFRYEHFHGSEATYNPADIEYFICNVGNELWGRDLRVESTRYGYETRITPLVYDITSHSTMFGLAGSVNFWDYSSYVDGIEDTWSYWDDSGNQVDYIVKPYFAEVPTGWSRRVLDFTNNPDGEELNLTPGWTPLHATPPSGTISLPIPLERLATYNLVLELSNGETWPINYAVNNDQVPYIQIVKFPNNDTLHREERIYYQNVTVWHNLPYDGWGWYRVRDNTSNDTSSWYQLGSNNSDLIKWAMPSESLSLEISVTRWNHDLVVTNFYDETYPITNGHVHGIWSTHEHTGLFTTEQWYDATARYRPYHHYWVVDRTTAEWAPLNRKDLRAWVANNHDNDTDSDRLPDWYEFVIGTHTDDPDSDDDGLSDYAELVMGTKPMNPDTDGDGLTDGFEVANEHILHANPRVADSDHDGASDGWEYFWNSSSNDTDTDNDGIGDGDEKMYGTHPNLSDSDGDGASDFDEIRDKTDPISHNLEDPNNPTDYDIPKYNYYALDLIDNLERLNIKVGGLLCQDSYNLGDTGAVTYLQTILKDEDLEDEGFRLEKVNYLNILKLYPDGTVEENELRMNRVSNYATPSGWSSSGYYPSAELYYTMNFSNLVIGDASVEYGIAQHNGVMRVWETSEDPASPDSWYNEEGVGFGFNSRVTIQGSYAYRLPGPTTSSPTALWDEPLPPPLPTYSAYLGNSYWPSGAWLFGSGDYMNGYAAQEGNTVTNYRLLSNGANGIYAEQISTMDAFGTSYTDDFGQAYTIHMGHWVDKKITLSVPGAVGARYFDISEPPISYTNLATENYQKDYVVGAMSPNGNFIYWTEERFATVDNDTPNLIERINREGPFVYIRGDAVERGGPLSSNEAYRGQIDARIEAELPSGIIPSEAEAIDARQRFIDQKSRFFALNDDGFILAKKWEDPSELYQRTSTSQTPGRGWIHYLAAIPYGVSTATDYIEQQYEYWELIDDLIPKKHKLLFSNISPTKLSNNDPDRRMPTIYFSADTFRPDGPRQRLTYRLDLRRVYATDGTCTIASDLHETRHVHTGSTAHLQSVPAKITQLNDRGDTLGIGLVKDRLSPPETSGIAGATAASVPLTLGAVRLVDMEIRPHPINADGSISDRTDTLKVSIPSPVFANPTCTIANVRYNAQGKLIGDITVKGSLSSEACDTLKGDIGKIEQAELTVNEDAKTRQVVNVTAIKAANGPVGRPYPYQGNFDQTLVGVPLVEGKNLIHLTAKDKVYHVPGYAKWTASVTFQYPTNTGIAYGSEFTMQVTLPHGKQVTDTPVVMASFTTGSATFDDTAFLREQTQSGNIFKTTVNGVEYILTLTQPSRAISASKRDYIGASLRLGTDNGSVPVLTLHETDSSSRIYTASLDITTLPPNPAGGGATTTTDPNSYPPPDPGTNPDDADADPSSVAVEQPGYADVSTGGEFYGYAMELKLPPGVITPPNASISIDGQVFKVKKDDDSGLLLVQNPDDEDKPMIASAQIAEEPVSRPALSEEEQQLRRSLSGANFGTGFLRGMWSGGVDIVTGTGKALVGTMKYVGRGLMVAALEIKFGAEWALGQDNTQTYELMMEYAQPNLDIHNSVTDTVKMLEPLAEWVKNNLENLGDLEVGLLTGNFGAFDDAALRSNELNGAIFSMGAEALTGMMEEYRDAPPGVKGYKAGRVVLEVATILLPFTKAGKLMEVKKVEVLAKLLQTKVLPPRVATKLGALKQALFGTKMCFVAGTPVLCEDGLKGIEEVVAGDVVWSRDEVTQVAGWRPVVEVFVTHPQELYYVSYIVRGPPMGGLEERLGVTGQHPFWVSNMEKPGFVAAAELVEGDVLALADGGVAEVVGLSKVEAARGEEFTTYNFEVEEFHTYFVGNAGVWVHNLSSKLCNDAVTLFVKTQKDMGVQRLPGNRLDIVQEAWKKTKVMPGNGPGHVLHALQREEFADYAAGKVPLNKLKSYAEQRRMLDNVGGSGPYDVHHVAEIRIQELLGINPTDDVPGIALPRSPRASGFDIQNYTETFGHEPIYHQGKRVEGSISQKIRDITRNYDVPPDNLGQRDILRDLQRLYEAEPYKQLNMWPVARDWLIKENPSLRLLMPN